MFKVSRLILVLVAATATLYAASDHSTSIKLDTDIRVGAISIPAGDYTLHWATDSGDMDLTISGEKHRHYSIPVTVKQNPDRQTGNPALITHREGDAQVLEGIKVKNTLLMVR